MEKSCDLLFTSWTPRRVSGVMTVKVQRPENQENWWSKSQPKMSFYSQVERGVKSHFLHLFILFRLSAGWMGPTHTRKDNLLYSRSSSDANLIQKLLHRHTQIKCLQALPFGSCLGEVSWAPGEAGEPLGQNSRGQVQKRPKPELLILSPVAEHCSGKTDSHLSNR